MILHSRNEFIERGQQLEPLIQEKWRTPLETLRSPQG